MLIDFTELYSKNGFKGYIKNGIMIYITEEKYIDLIW